MTLCLFWAKIGCAKAEGMKIKEIHVSDEVADKIARKHNVCVEEVCEVFWNEYDRPVV